MSAKVVYLGSLEADARAFERLVADDFPNLSLYATNDRADALAHLDDVEGIIAHHYQFDAALLQQATRLRWIQSLTTGTDGIMQLPNLRPGIIVTSTRGMHGPQMSELVFLQMLVLLRDFDRIRRNQYLQ